MGELRGDHFHMGIDIKTNGKIGILIHASKSGYIERIRIGTRGYGRALYMNHNDGTKQYMHIFQNLIILLKNSLLKNNIKFKVLK